MKRRYLTLFMAALFAVGISSCREEADNDGDDMEDAIEETSEDVEDEMED